MLSLPFPEYHVTEKTVAAEVKSWGQDPVSLLPLVGLAGREEDDPFRLSRGELKRLHLACILAGEHGLLILDDPFCSLDWREKRRVCTLLEQKRRGITLLFTHERSILPHVDYSWEIRDGALHLQGEPLEEGRGSEGEAV